jgi:acyl-CoA synthetase (NDP forming)
MARARRPGEAPLPPTRGPGASALAALLGSRRFRLGAGSQRVAANLSQHGGEVASDAAAWIGLGRPPSDSPSVALDAHPGTLGPRSFGFLNNLGRVAALDAPLPELPRAGGLGLVVPRRDALPDLGPLSVARGLGLSWIISVGDGDPAEALAFLAADAATRALAVVLGDGADGATLRGVLGAKPAVVWGGDELCRAVVRRSGASAAASLDEWLARAALLDAGVEPGARVSVVVVGGGRAFVETELRAAGLEATLVNVETPDEIPATNDALLVVASALPQAPGERILAADLRHPEHLRALLSALASPAVEPGGGRVPSRVDKELAAKVRAEVDIELTDHDAKRLLKAWGARVTRQAPTPTPTRAVAIAQQIGLPVELVVGNEPRVVDSPAEVRRIAALLLPSASQTQPLMVRERFAETPRARLRVAQEKGLGLVARVGTACALCPLTRVDAQALAAATLARRAADQKSVAELLIKIAACAAGENTTFDLELFVGAEPCVIAASGQLKR